MTCIFYFTFEREKEKEKYNPKYDYPMQLGSGLWYSPPKMWAKCLGRAFPTTIN